MTAHEKHMLAQWEKGKRRIKDNARMAKGVLTSWHGLYTLGFHKTNRLNIFNF